MSPAAPRPLAPRPRRGLSLDRLVPAAASAAASRRSRPPLRRSLRLDDDAARVEERRRVFVQGPRAPSFDEGDVSDEYEPECECARASRDLSTPDRSLDDDAPELASPPPDPPPVVLRRPSTLARPPPRAHSQGVFERRLPRIYKFGLMDKSKRASSSALYEKTDRSPTEAFYNATGSTRLSSQELFEKFCSEDFTSLYGHEDRRKRRPPHSKSTGSSGSDVRAERVCCRQPCGSQPTLGRRIPGRIIRSDRSTDSEEPSPHRNIPPPLASTDVNIHHADDDCSRSAPPLSPDDRFEQRFTFDISEHSEAPSLRDDTSTSNQDETPSDATETRNLTLYEEPHSDRTSICDLYDAAFSSQRPSFRRDSSRRRRGPVDLSTLDFRAIDDESPRGSRRTSHRSTDETLRQCSESRSWASDSVFTTPERRQQVTSPSSIDTRKEVETADSLRADSATADSTAAESTAADWTIGESTVVEEEQPSVIERAEYTLALKLGRIDLDDVEMSPKTPKASSRTSLPRLEPAESGLRRRRGASEPRRAARCVPL